MPRLIITEAAAQGIERCRRFLAARNAPASRRAAEAIMQQFARIAAAPATGRPVPGHPGLSELVVSFGASGYVALYRHEPADDSVYVLAFRHQKEAGT